MNKTFFIISLKMKSNCVPSDAKKKFPAKNVGRVHTSWYYFILLIQLVATFIPKYYSK